MLRIKIKFEKFVKLIGFGRMLDWTPERSKKRTGEEVRYKENIFSE